MKGLRFLMAYGGAFLIVAALFYLLLVYGFGLEKNGIPVDQPLRDFCRHGGRMDRPRVETADPEIGRMGKPGGRLRMAFSGRRKPGGFFFEGTCSHGRA